MPQKFCMQLTLNFSLSSRCEIIEQKEEFLQKGKGKGFKKSGLKKTDLFLIESSLPFQSLLGFHETFNKQHSGSLLTIT